MSAKGTMPDSGFSSGNGNGLTPSGVFNRAAGFLKKHIKPAAIIGGILLGGTALGTAMLGTTLGAALGFGIGCAILSQTSNTLIDNSKEMGDRLGMSPLLMGTLLGCATSFPELAVSLGAISQGAAELGIGNVVGSNIANVGLILGLTAAIRPLPEQQGVSWKFNTKAMAASTALFGAQLLLGGTMMPVMGAAMIGALGYYLYQSYQLQKIDAASAPAPQKAATSGDEGKSSTATNLLWAAGGLAGLVFSANFLVSSATVLATGLGVNPALVGAFAVAVGTSLPELVVNIKSVLRGETDMALGNILGSNVFNTLMVGGALAMAGTAIPADFSARSLLGVLNLGGFLLSGGLLARSMLQSEGGISRKMGAAMLGLYGVFAFASANVADSPAAPQPAEKTAVVQVADAVIPPQLPSSAPSFAVQP